MICWNRYVNLLFITAILVLFLSNISSAEYQLTQLTSAEWHGTIADRLQAEVSDSYQFDYGDDAVVSFTLPWSFNINGTNYAEIIADTDGHIWFDATGSGPQIAVWNTDLDSYYQGGVFVQHKTNPERVVVQWQTETAIHAGYGRVNNIEAVLFSDGKIQINYSQVSTFATHDAGSGIYDGNRWSYLPQIVPELSGTSFQWAGIPVVDTDSDGVHDSTDAFPTDPAASVDTDGDGSPDSWNDGYSQSDSTTGLVLDAYPDDATRHIVVATHQDLDADGDSDILLRNTTNGQWRTFTMQNMIPTGNSGIVLWANQDWVYQDMADYDRDGDSDVLMRSISTGNWRLFTIQDGGVTSNTAPNLWRNQDYVYQTSADFDADGDADILLRDTTTGFYRLFTVEDGAITGSVTLSALWRSATWAYAGAADFDNDGDADILLRNTDTGEWRLFTVANGDITGSYGFNAWKTLTWTLQGLADYDKDGDADLLMRDINGYWQIFEVQDGQVTSNNVIYLWSNLQWVNQSAQHDLDGDGDADILLRNSSTGLWRSFTIENLSVTGNGSPLIWANQDWQMKWKKQQHKIV